MYVPRRDTASRLVAILGGRAFPGWQHRADFRVEEGDGHYRIEVASRDGEVELAVAARRSDRVMPGSVFATTEEASAFFRDAPVAYSATPAPGTFDGVALAAEGWAVTPLGLGAGVLQLLRSSPDRRARQRLSHGQPHVDLAASTQLLARA